MNKLKSLLNTSLLSNRHKKYILNKQEEGGDTDSPFENGLGTNSAQQKGSGAVANGTSSVAEGKGTITENEAEHAEGKFNKSNSGTLHSVGIGSSNTERKNAFEIMQNGDTYVVGLGGYDGTNPGDGSESLQQIIGDVESLINAL